MPDFKIEKNIPVRPTGAGRPHKYPVRSMGVGDSFAVPVSESARAKAAACRERRINGKTFKYGADANKPGFVRIWRMEDDKKRILSMDRFFVFDVESIGIHGEGFAVAGGVYSSIGNNVVSEFSFAANPDLADGGGTDRQWVRENVPYLEVTHNSLASMREAFWDKWKQANEVYPEILMAVECGWPVETQFLRTCAIDLPVDRFTEGPYPLVEISSFMAAAGMDPLEEYARSEFELPKHDPLKDARQSARLLFEAISKLKA